MFNLNPYLLVDHFDVLDHYWDYGKCTHAFYGTKYLLQFKKKKCENVTNIWLSKILVFNSSKISFSTILPKISRCEVTTLQLTACTMSESDLKFLTKWGKTERFFLREVTVFNSENIQLSLDGLLAYALYANEIRIETTFTTAETSKNLAKLNKTQKFKSFIVDELEGILDHELMYEFIKKNAGINSYFSIEFFQGDEMTQFFKELLKNQLRQLNWENILLKDAPSEYAYDDIYFYFNSFLNGIFNETNDYCGCWNGDGCSACLYKDDSLNDSSSSVKANEESMKEHPSLMTQIWHFFVKNIQNFFEWFIFL
uniref:F-box associated domain-containing protein n=1 Tax=Panagrolaimus superbus TaxID=310955 RepID=A0A914YZJ5_9BILA